MGATKVYLFGSIVDGGVYDETSDIDLAVEGISADKYLDVYGPVESISGGRPFDLVLLETASDLLKSSVVERGVEI